VLLSFQRWTSGLSLFGVPGKKGSKGDKGEKGDKGDPGLTIVVTDETLAGDGTPKNPLMIARRRCMTESEMNRLYEKIFENKVTRLFECIFQDA
jgi:hypothetical protein